MARFVLLPLSVNLPGRTEKGPQMWKCVLHGCNRTPALRGNAAAGLLRMMAQNSIARPSMRGAHQAAELWISELAEADEVLLEYFTAEEPEMQGEAASPVQSNVSPEVVQQLQARIAQLETQQAAPSGGLARVVDLEPRPHAAGRSVLFAFDQELWNAFAP